MAPASVQETPFTITVYANDAARRAIVKVDGELDLASADELAATLHEQRRRGRRYLRLDLSGLTFMDATALGVIVENHHEMRGALTLGRLSRPVRRLLELTGLRDAFGVDGLRQRTAEPPHSLVAV